MGTKIQWCTESWNPVTGCNNDMISPGCLHCYARRMANTRLRGRFGYPADEPFRVTFHPDKLEQPFHWRKPRLIFVCSMGDLFHDDVNNFTIFKIISAMHEAYWHRFILLTKRPERMRNYFANFKDNFGSSADQAFYKENPLRATKNLWLGVTCENQATADERIPILLQIPAAVRFVSYEPALGPLVLREQWLGGLFSCVKLAQVIAGCESGARRRPAKIEWFRSALNQCRETGTAFFMKQMEIDGKVCHNISKFPHDLQIREYPERS